MMGKSVRNTKSLEGGLPLKAISGQTTHAPPSPGSKLALVQVAVPCLMPLSGNF